MSCVTNWSKQELDILKELYPSNQTKNILAHFNGKSAAIIRCKANNLGIRKEKLFTKPLTDFTKDHDELIIHHRTIDNPTNFKELAKIVGVSEKIVRRRAIELGVHNDTITEEDLSFIKDNYGKIQTMDLAKMFNVTRQKIRTIINELKMQEDEVPKEIDFETNGKFDIDKYSNYCF